MHEKVPGSHSNYNFAQWSEALETLTHPDIRSRHDDCISSWYAGHFTDEIAYEQGVLTIIHRYDEAKQELHDNYDKALNIAGIALCVADIHYQTGHYLYCADELTFLRRITTGTLHEYVTDALGTVSRLEDVTSERKHTPVRSEILLG